MVNQLGFAKRFLSLVTPIVTSSALAPLVLNIAALPGMAATLSFSGANVNIDNFSQKPLSIETFTDTNTVAIATNGQVTAEADAFADFNQSPPFASNLSFSEVNGDGSDYFGFAKSEAAVIGYNFLVEGGKTFSFDFEAVLGLETSIDAPQSEVASAAGELSLELYDSTNPDNLILLDSFTLSGALTTPGSDDFLTLNYDNSDYISLNRSGSSFDTSFGGTEEFANAEVQGSFSRTFDSFTSLTLVEAKSNQASAAVPEPASTVALLFCLTGLGYKIRNKAFGTK